MKLVELFENASVIEFNIVSNDELITRSNIEDNNIDLNKRLKYVNFDKNQFYITAEINSKIIGIAILQINPYNRHVLWVPGISVDQFYKNQKIATQLIDKIFQYATEHNLIVDPSTYTEEGELYLKHIFDRLNNQKKQIFFNKKSKNNVDYH